MIMLGTDHSGIELKDYIKEKMLKDEYKFIDVSEKNIDGDDYPDIVENMCSKLKEEDFGIMICGTGIGSSIVANKIKGIRAAVCHDNYTAKLTRYDNNANVLCLGSRTDIAKDKEYIYEIVKTFLNTPFSSDERHIRRLNKISKIENRG